MDRVKSFGNAIVEGLASGAYPTDGYLGWYPIERMVDEHEHEQRAVDPA